MMSDLPEFKIYTYSSANAPEAYKWASYIWTGDAGFWPIRFSGPAEADVLAKAHIHYEECREQREAAIRNRLEGRKKAAEARARKKADEGDDEIAHHYEAMIATLSESEGK